MENVGFEIASRLYDTMMIDPEWSLRTDSGFKWWGHRLAQTVWASPMRESGPYRISTVTAVTDLVTDIEDPYLALIAANELNKSVGLSSYILNQDSSAIISTTAGVFHDENRWLERLFGVAVATQAADAHSIASQVAEASGGKVAASAHKTSGPRPDPDDLLNLVAQLPGRADFVPFTKDDFNDALDLGPQMWEASSSNAHGVVLVFTGDGDSRRGRLKVREIDPESSDGVDGPDNPPAALRLGTGLSFVFEARFPELVGQSVPMASMLNQMEAFTGVRFHRFGGWFGDYRGLWHTTHIPNICFLPLTEEQRRILLYNLLTNHAARVRWLWGVLDSIDTAKGQSPLPGQPEPHPAEVSLMQEAFQSMQSGNYVEAMTAFEQARAHYREAGDAEGQATALMGYAMAAHNSEKTSEAYDALLEAAEMAKENLTQARLHAMAGDLALHLGHKDAADRHHETSIRTFELTDQPKEAFEVANRRANIAERAHLPREAITWLEVALVIAQGSEAADAESDAAMRLGSLLVSTNQPDRALEAYGIALDAVESEQDRVAQARASSGRAVALNDLGELTEAFRLHQGARDVFEEEQALYDLATSEMELGIVAIALGRPREAVAHYQAALEGYREHGQPIDIARCLQNLGNALRATDSGGRALAAHRAAKHHYQSMGLTRNVADCDVNIANILRNLSLPSAARSRYQNAMNDYQRLNLPTEVADCLDSLGSLSTDMGDYERGMAESSRALSSYREHEHREGEAACLLNLAHALDHTGNHNDAEIHARGAMDIYAAMGAALKVADCNLGLAYTLNAQGRHDEAVLAANSAREAYLNAGLEWDQRWHEEFVSDIRAGTLAPHSHALEDGDIDPATPDQACPLCGSQVVKKASSEIEPQLRDRWWECQTCGTGF